MIRNDVPGLAEVIDALEDEIEALQTLDPYDPQIPMLQERMAQAIHDLYRAVPRGV